MSECPHGKPLHECRVCYPAENDPGATTSPDEPQTPRTDEQIVTGQVCEDFKDARGKWLTQVKFERNTEWVCADLSRQLELELRGSHRIIDEMGVELQMAQELLRDIIDANPRYNATTELDERIRAAIKP